MGAYRDITPVPPVSARAAGHYDVTALRKTEFPWADRCIYLNHASTGPLPERARRAIEALSRERSEPFRLSDERLQGILADARRRAARLIHADVEEIALTTNTSYGLNLAARMLPLEPGDLVLVSDGEFPANVFPWRQLADKGVRMELLPVTARGWPDEAAMLERMTDPRVRVLAISHVQFHTGYKADLARLGAAARANGTWLVVDAIQALGQVPFDVRETPGDPLACGAPKGLPPPSGAGVCLVRPGVVPAVRRRERVPGHRHLPPALQLQGPAPRRRPPLRARHAAVPGPARHGSRPRSAGGDRDRGDRGPPRPDRKSK